MPQFLQHIATFSLSDFSMYALKQAFVHVNYD
jgi:hypothetical protein